MLGNLGVDRSSGGSITKSSKFKDKSDKEGGKNSKGGSKGTRSKDENGERKKSKVNGI